MLRNLQLLFLRPRFFIASSSPRYPLQDYGCSSSLFRANTRVSKAAFPNIIFSAECSTSTSEQSPIDTNVGFRYLKRRDARNYHPPEVSIRYMESNAYKQTYGDTPVWVPYRRNHKGMYPPKRTRHTCLRHGNIINTGTPCPICRDEYLTIHPTNTKLLQQFISPYTDEILRPDKTGLCHKQHTRLCVAIEKAKDEGLITFQVPFRTFDYKQFYTWLKPKTELEKGNQGSGDETRDAEEHETIPETQR